MIAEAINPPSLASLVLCILLLICTSRAAKVSDAPKLIGLLDELNNPEDTNATITCSLGSGEMRSLTYEWFKDKERLYGNTNKIKIDIPAENYQSVLRVFNLRPSDSALYTCVAKNRFGQDKILTKLNVQVQLKWTSQPSDLQAPVGQQVHIACRAEGNPAPKIDWYKIDETKSGQEQREYLGSELMFSPIEQRHSGYYECRASNGAEEDLVTKIKLNVLDHCAIMDHSDFSAATYVASTFYGIVPIEDDISALVGYDDKNFLITDSSDKSTKYVLKVVNKDQSKEELTEIIDQVIDAAHEATTSDPKMVFVVPKLIKTSSDKLSAMASVRLKTPEGDYEDFTCNVKLYEFYQGIAIVDFVNNHQKLYNPSELYTRLGRLCNHLHRFMRTQRHHLEKLKQIRADFPWQLATCEQNVQKLVEKFYPRKGSVRRALIENVLSEFRKIKDKLATFPEFVLHGDLSGKNILIKKEEPDTRICLIDFQDLQIGQQVAEVAILTLYCILEQQRMDFHEAILRIPCWILSGYQEDPEYALSEDELDFIPTLMKLRLSQSLLNGLQAYELKPDNEYTMSTNKRGWYLLELILAGNMKC